jgi:tetratricopeptide (TPR) repeat protein
LSEAQFFRIVPLLFDEHGESLEHALLHNDLVDMDLFSAALAFNEDLGPANSDNFNNISTSASMAPEFPLQFSVMALGSRVKPALDSPWLKSRFLFTAEAGMLDPKSEKWVGTSIHVPLLRVYRSPDATSELICGNSGDGRKQSFAALPGAPITCSVFTRSGGLPVATIERAVQLEMQPSTLLLNALPSTKNTPLCGAGSCSHAEAGMLVFRVRMPLNASLTLHMRVGDVRLPVVATLLARVPENQANPVASATLLLYQGHFAAAASVLGAALMDPSAAAGHGAQTAHLLAHVQLLLGDFSAAAALLPNHHTDEQVRWQAHVAEVAGHAHKGLFALTDGRLRAALGHLSQALQFAPASIPLRMARANAALQTGNYAIVQHDTVAVLRVEPSNVRAAVVLAAAVAEILGDTDMAQRAVDHCLRHTTGASECIQRQRWLQSVDGLQRQAARAEAAAEFAVLASHLQALVELAPRGPLGQAAQARLCLALANVPDYVGTVAACTLCLNRVRESDPVAGVQSDEETKGPPMAAVFNDVGLPTSLHILYLTRARAYFELKQLDRAQRDITRARMLNKTDEQVEQQKGFLV